MVAISWSKSSGIYFAGVLLRRHVVGETTKALGIDADDLGRRLQRLFERGLADAAGGEGMIGDDRRLRRHHQRQVGVQNRLAVERAELAAGIAANAEAILAADIKRHLGLKRAPGGVEKADHAAEMIVMAMAEHQRVEGRRVDVEDAHIVEQHLRRIAEIDHDVALDTAGKGLRMHRQAPFAVENAARRFVGKSVAAFTLDGQAVALFGLHELDDDIVGDDAHRQFIDHRHIALQCLRRLGALAGGQGRHHRRDETGAAGAQRTEVPDQAGRRNQLQTLNSMKDPRRNRIRRIICTGSGMSKAYRRRRGRPLRYHAHFQK